MATRRQLVEGLKPKNAVDRSLEEEFIYNGGPKSAPATKPQPSAPAAESAAGKGRTDSSPARIPLTVRFRADYAAVLKRAALERQLQAVRRPGGTGADQPIPATIFSFLATLAASRLVGTYLDQAESLHVG